MTIWQAILLGIIQGLAEFLPISSKGHLAVTQFLLGKNIDLSFDVLLHFATLVAIVMVLWDDIWSLRAARRRLILPLVLGSIPAAIVGLLFKEHFEAAKHSMLAAGMGFIATGVVLAVGERLGRNKQQKKHLSGIGFADAIVVGCAQAVALLPGVSRSGMTISGALTRGVNREDCVRFSFLLALPAMAGACLLERKEILTALHGPDVLPTVIATMASFVSSVLAIKLLLSIVRTVPVSVFSYYLLPLGMLLVAFYAPEPVSRWTVSLLRIAPETARILSYALIAVFVTIVIRLVFFGLLRREQSA